MEVKVVLIAALLGLFHLCTAQMDGNNCTKASAQSCGECIHAGEKCGWCTHESFLKQGESESIRCDEIEALIKKGCPNNSIENPRGKVEIIRTEDLDANCRADNGTDICSNNGDCICGACECRKRDNPEERYQGKFCECDNFSCDRASNKLCGGHGQCVCRVCVCDANYTGSACDCSLDTQSCVATNGQICNGRGICECGVCKCTDQRFQGPTCEVCPTCPGVCTEHKSCVQCMAFKTGELKDVCEEKCSYLKNKLHMVKKKEDVPPPNSQPSPIYCAKRDANNCWWFFTYATTNDTVEVYVAEERECPPTRAPFSEPAPDRKPQCADP